MTERYDIILWIAIVVFMVPSAHSILSKNMEGVCYENISVLRRFNVSYIETYKFEYSCWFGTQTCYETKSRRAYKIEVKKVPTLFRKCCDDYKKKNGTCEPNCSSKCMNGYCALPENCTCNYGWSGEFCNESSLCSLRLDSSKAMSEPPNLKNVKTVTEHLSINRTLPECLSSCHEQLGNMTAVGKTPTVDSVLYFLPIDSSCNLIVEEVRIPWKEYGILIGAVIGIVSLAMGAYALYIVRKKRKIRHKVSNGSTQFSLANYMEENALYSGTRGSDL